MSDAARRLVRYEFECLHGHHVEWETTEWPGWTPVHCTHPDCFHVPLILKTGPEFVRFIP